MKLSEIVATVIRWVAGVSKESHEHDAEPKDIEPAESNASGLITIGCFSPQEFEVIRKRLEVAGIGFRIECDTVAPGINVDGMYSERQTVHVYVHEKDAQAASKIVDELRLEEGGVSTEHA